jgi:hypothetical protein
MASFPLLAIRRGRLHRLGAGRAGLAERRGLCCRCYLGQVAAVSGRRSVAGGRPGVLLCVEVYRATSSSTAAILNHVLSLVVFIVALIELLVMPRMANMTFFLIVLMTLSDVIAGFTVTISTARRDMQRPS